MHICFATLDNHHQNGGGGIASYVNTLGSALVARGHQVTILAKGTKYRLFDKNGLRTIEFPLGNLHWYMHRLHVPGKIELIVREIEWSLALRWQIKRIMAEFPIDILEGCETGIMFLNQQNDNWPPLIARLHGETYVFNKYSGQKLNFGEKIKHQIELATLRKSAGITSPSQFQATEIANDMKFPSKKIRVIPNPIGSRFVNESANFRNDLNRKTSAPIVLYTGRIAYTKGTLTLLRSIPKVAQTIQNFQYIIAGGRHPSINDKTLNRFLIDSIIGTHLQLLGHIPWNSLIDWYKKATLFVLPSFYETFGISAIEAMIFGLPVVGTTAGGLPEVVEHGVTGLLVPPGDEQSLGEAIAELLGNPDLRLRMGKAGRERVLAEFTVDRLVMKTLEYYKEVIKGD